VKLTEEQIRVVVRQSLLEAKMELKSIVFKQGAGANDELLSGENWIPEDNAKGTIKDITGLCSDQWDGIDDFAKSILSKWFAALNAKGYNVLRTCGYRSVETQGKIKSHGQSVAKAGYSPHNFGLAVDLNISWKDKDGKDHILKMASPQENWVAVMKDAGWQSFKDKIQWGGVWKDYDPVHFDVYPSLPGSLSRNNTANLLNKKAKKSGKSLYSDIKEVDVG